MTVAAYEARMYQRLGLQPDAGRPAFEAAQSAHLAATVAQARALSPFYRRRADWPDAPFTGIADLPRLPFTTPDDLTRADPPLVAVSGGDVARIVTLPTSGTSGPPKRVQFAAEDLEATADYFHHGMAVFTSPGDRVAIAFAADRPASIGDGLAVALRRLGAIPLQIATAHDPQSLVVALRREAADIVAGPPVSLLAAARSSAADDGPPIRLKAVLVSSDHAAPSLKRAIAAAWHCEVYEHWGMTETGYGGAVDCAAHAGLHLREADLFVEVIDPATGEPLPPGREGEIVFTTLQPRATPLIRYRTGDRGCLVEGDCSCGSRLRRLAGLSGRIGDAAIVGDIRLTQAAIDDAVFAVDGVTDLDATLIAGSPATLSLRIAAPPRYRIPVLGVAVRSAVAAVPQWAPAVAAGSLRVVVTLADASLLQRTAKRRLRHEEDPCANSG